MRKNKTYIETFKEMVVKAYLSGQHGGLITVSKYLTLFQVLGSVSFRKQA